MSTMKKLIVITAFIFAAMAAASAQGKFEPKVFESSEGIQLNYQELKPIDTAKEKKYPLVIFLHGMGERGDDNKTQLTHGSQMFLNPANQEKYPAYVLFPQCPETAFWAYARPTLNMKAEDKMPPIFQAVKEMIDKYLAYPDIDTQRVYIMGLSMGGMATFDMVARFPEIFAAAVPICGAVDPSRLAATKGVNFRIFHGDADRVVPVICSRMAYKALREADVDVEYYEFPGCDHASWNPAFNRPDFMEWLFKQKKAKKYMK